MVDVCGRSADCEIPQGPYTESVGIDDLMAYSNLRAGAKDFNHKAHK